MSPVWHSCFKCGHFYIFVQIPPVWHSCFKMWPLFSSSPPLSFNLMPASDTREKETVFFENSKLQISSDKRSCRERRRIVPVVLVCQSWLFAAGQNWRKWANSDIPPQLVRCLRQGEEGWNKQPQRYNVTWSNSMIIHSWLPYSTYLFLDFHSFCSITKLAKRTQQGNLFDTRFSLENLETQNIRYYPIFRVYPTSWVYLKYRVYP